MVIVHLLGSLFQLFFPPAVNSTLQVFMVFTIKFMTYLIFWDSLLSSFVGLYDIIIIILLLCECFVPALADGLPLKFESQVSSFFSVFWLILMMLSFGWSPLILLFLNPQVPLSILWWLYHYYYYYYYCIFIYG